MAANHESAKSDKAPVMKGIILDFGGVFTKTRPRNVVLHECEDQLRLPRGALLDLLFVGEHWYSVSTGRLSADDYWQHVSDALSGKVPPALEPFKHNPFAYEELNVAMVRLVRRLHHHYEIGLLSNATPYLEVLVEQHGLMHFFDVIVNSARVGLRKPDPEIYRLMLVKLELEPQQCLFVDDKERNTEVAQVLGMETVVFRSVADLERQLRKRHMLD